MQIGPNSQIAIAGAGSIGCYAGGCLLLAGRDVRLLARQSVANPLAQFGLRVSDRDNFDATIPPARLRVSVDPAEMLAGADIVIVTVKAGNTEEMARLVAAHAPADAVIVSFQNGVGNAPTLRRICGERRTVIPAMVPFNVVQMRKTGEAPQFHRASAGTLQIGAGLPGLKQLLDVPGLAVAENADIEAVLWAKLLLNLNNGLNALSGLPLAGEFADRRWRVLLARQIEEGLRVLKANNIRVAKLEGLPLSAIAMAMRLPNWLFRLVARRMLAFDEKARSSMWDDLEARRATEIDFIQGEILKRATAKAIGVPVIARVSELIKQAERARCGSPHLSPQAVTES